MAGRDMSEPRGSASRSPERGRCSCTAPPTSSPRTAARCARNARSPPCAPAAAAAASRSATPATATGNAAAGPGARDEARPRSTGARRLRPACATRSAVGLRAGRPARRGPAPGPAAGDAIRTARTSSSPSTASTSCTTGASPGVDAEREWDLDLLRVRQALERAFLAALRAEVPAGRRRRAGDRRAADRAGRSRRHRCVAPPAPRRRGLAAARVPRAPLALPPQGGGSAGVGDPAAARGGQGGAGHRGARRVRRGRPGARARAAVRGDAAEHAGWTTATASTWIARLRRRWPRST